MSLDRFFVFVRSDRHEWFLSAAYETLHVATHSADRILTEQSGDRAVVMEVGGVDAMPTFTFKYRATKA